MDWENPVTWVLVPGLLGGLVIALAIFKLQRRGQTAASDDAFTREPLSTNVINMARIRVAGIGGLGLVAMAVAVALNVPRIGETLSVGLLLGVLLAALLILWRRRQGPMPSSGRSAGANAMLSIDNPPPSADAKDQESPPPCSEVAAPAVSR